MIDLIPNYRVGFTGTRAGMNAFQREQVRKMLAYAISQGPTVGIHGDCIGADKDFHDLCVELDIEPLCRPCTLPAQRAFTGALELAPPEHPLNRNKKIVEGSSIMLATPNTDTEELRSGTWSTVRHARSCFVPLVVFLPGGRISSNTLQVKST